MAQSDIYLEPEFRFDISENQIHTHFTPMMGQRFCLNQSLKRADNPYGIAGYKDDLKAKVSSLTKNDYNHLIDTLNHEDESIALDALNYLFLENNLRDLINCLFFNRYVIRKGAFTLLMENIEINNKTASFFNSFFQGKSPTLTIMIPSGFETNYRKHLDREVVRWLTAMYTEIGNHPIWLPFKNSPLEIQEIELATTEEKAPSATLPEMKLRASSLINDVLLWLASTSKAPQTIISQDLTTNPEKIYQLRNKWQKANNKIKTSHKFLTKLIENWVPGKPSEFMNAFEVFYSGLSKGSKQIFFIYCSSSNDETLQAISWKSLTEIFPIDPKDLFKDKKYAQQLTKAIFQSKLYGEHNTHHPNFEVISQHYTDLITQLREVENIFIPDDEKHFDITWANGESISTIQQIKKTKYPHTRRTLSNYHFEVQEPQTKFLPYKEQTPCSAHQILAISGIAIETPEFKSSIHPLPTQYSNWESQYKVLFKASNKFDPRYHKVPIKTPKAKKEENKTLDDIFNTGTPSSNDPQNPSLDDLFS